MSGKPAFEHGGNVQSAWREKGGQVLDFSANINPLGLADSVRQAIQSVMENIIHYPDCNAPELKQAISTFYHVPPESITLGNGAVEPVYILCQIMRPRRVLITAPTFSEYERAALSVGAQIEPVLLKPQEDFKIRSEEIIARLNTVDIVFITNPNNPTGTLMTSSEIKEVLLAAKQAGVMVVVDESFMDFILDPKFSCKPLLTKYDNLIILHSLTKFFAIPGLRLGFALANPVITNKLSLAKDPWNVNTLAQAAGVAALTDTEYQKKSISYMAAENMALYEALTNIQGIKAFKPSVNFMLLDIAGTGLTSTQLCEKAYQHDILLRDCSNYRGLSNEYIRVAVKRRDENAKLVAALTAIIQEGM